MVMKNSAGMSRLVYSTVLHLSGNSVAESAVDHGTLPDRVFEGIRDLIVRGRFISGDRVREAAMAVRFGASRTPVREALARLVQEGFLTPVSGGSRTELAVTALTADSVLELWGMIGALESYAIQAVTELPDARRLAIATDVMQLNSELRIAAAKRPRNHDRLFELQSAIHTRFVYESAGNRLRSIYDSLRPHVQRYEWVYGTRADAPYEPSASEHMKIITAIREGSPAAARAAVETHWRNAAVRTVQVMSEVLSAPPRKPRRKAVR
jgi:DNA-binding GntR family transcriptional regulator